MRRPIVILSAVLLAGSLAAAHAQTPPQGQAAPAMPAAATTTLGPSELVQQSAQGMLTDLDKNRDAYRRDPSKISALVDKWLLPHFDTEFSARLVLGKYWRTATPEQRQAFIDAFYHSLLTNYGNALSSFTANRLKIYPNKVDPDATRATVRTEVKRDNGDVVSVNYYLRKTPQGWKAWDVVIDGISYVNSYREDFGAQIEQQGLDAVIKRLQSGESPGAITHQALGKDSGAH
ncbi:MAG: ABC transporter substrate-binding protein [Steroidobacteraceae bacterium]